MRKAALGNCLHLSFSLPPPFSKEMLTREQRNLGKTNIFLNIFLRDGTHPVRGKLGAEKRL